LHPKNVARNALPASPGNRSVANRQRSQICAEGVNPFAQSSHLGGLRRVSKACESAPGHVEFSFSTEQACKRLFESSDGDLGGRVSLARHQRNQLHQIGGLLTSTGCLGTPGTPCRRHMIIDGCRGLSCVLATMRFR
jgi:hypothetical protein